MSFKNVGWKPYSKKAKSIEINVKNNDNQTIDFFKIYKGKTRDAENAMKRIRNKYDFELLPDTKEATEKEIEEEKKEKKVLDKDMTW